jgi:hypothetical protein
METSRTTLGKASNIDAIFFCPFFSIDRQFFCHQSIYIYEQYNDVQERKRTQEKSLISFFSDSLLFGIVKFVVVFIKIVAIIGI